MPALAAVQSSFAFTSPNRIDQALQRELAALATLEAAHRSACRWLDEWSGPQAVKEHIACRLEARHRAEQEPHVLRLADLHQEQMLLAMAGETGEHTDADRLLEHTYRRPLICGALDRTGVSSREPPRVLLQDCGG